MKPGETFNIFNRPYEHKSLEGTAALVEPAPLLTFDPEIQRWLVQFNPAARPVVRWVHRSDRVEE